MLAWWQGLAAFAALTPLGAIVQGPGLARRTAAVLLATGTLSIPFLVAREPRLGVTACALLCALGPLKSLQLWLDPVHHSVGLRVWHCLMPFDARRARRVTPGLDRPAVTALVLNLAAAAVGGWLVGSADGLRGPAHEALRIAAGLLGLYGFTSAAAAVYVLVHRLIGIAIPAMMDAPILSRSIAEFWGRRWNRTIHEMLRDAFYRPLARRRQPRLGVLAAFLGSAALHFWVVVFAVGPWPALVAASFFVVQAVLALAEDRLRVRRWRPAAARAWTLGAFALSAPLFIEPFLRALGL